MTQKTGFREWLWQQRKASRLAYLLQVGSRILASLFALFWTRLLFGAMGKEVNSVYLAFVKVLSFGGLGDLGMGGAVGIRTGQFLGEGREDEARKFLTSARTIFFLLALCVTTTVIVLSPWLPHWLGFKSIPGSGSVSVMFLVGSVMMGLVLISSYISNVNYACGNVTWPVIPSFILLQVTVLAHWLLARQNCPLWMQFIPYGVNTIIGISLMWFYVRVSHPVLGNLFPMHFDCRMTAKLIESSFWVYLCSLGNMIYRSTDGLVINAGFPLGTLSGYEYNYKFCELVVFVVLTASFVTLPKITLWMSSNDPKDQDRVRVEMRRLNQFQTLSGCGAALAYLAANNLFMSIWWRHSADPVLPADLPLQLAFALNMAVTASGDAGTQLALRSGDRGLRTMGTVIGLTGLLNLGLSLVAMKMNSLLGVALATVVAQSACSLIASSYICRHLKIAWAPWALKGWLLPLIGICFAGWLRMVLPMDSPMHIVMLLGSYALMLAVAAWALGVDLAFIKEELKIVKKFTRK